MPNKKTEKLEKKCLFCILGEEDNGLIRVSETIEINLDKRDESVDSFFNKTRTTISYECALGEIGKDCIIPEIYNLLKSVNQTDIEKNKYT